MVNAFIEAAEYQHMKIEIQKKTPYQCVYSLTRADKNLEVIALDTKTYLLHDLCHYVVEKHLKYADGFWGSLAGGAAFKELFGKENPQTEGLRFIEKIVGPVQSVYWGHIPPKDFEACISHLQFPVPKDFAAVCRAEIASLMQTWEALPVGGQLTLDWNL